MLAARLGESDVRVVLVEAGPDLRSDQEPSEIRDTYYTAFFHPRQFWPDLRVHFASDPGAALGRRYEQARVLGGGSSVNAMIAMRVDDVSPVIVRLFLDHLERDRQCSIVTRNQRLGTTRSLARFIATRSPVPLSWCTEVRSIPFKKTIKALIGYLEHIETKD